jgi:hypothetical protein
MDTRLVFGIAAIALASLTATDARAAYPVSGTWTYDNANESGPARRCGPRRMKFEGVMRYDTETAAPSYRNLSVQQVGAGRWRVVDQLYTGVVWGKVYYTLRLVDEDHVSLHLDKGGNLNTGGASWLLRRCV